MLAHDVDEAGQLGRLLAARGQHGEQGGDFDLGHVAGEDLGEHVGGLLAGERGAVFGERLEKVLQRIHISHYGNGTRVTRLVTGTSTDRRRPVCGAVVQQDSIWVPLARSRWSGF